MKDVKKHADKFVEQFYNTTLTEINVIDATKCAILSVEKTIKVLENEFYRFSNKGFFETGLGYLIKEELNQTLSEQTELLSELKLKLKSWIGTSDKI